METTRAVSRPLESSSAEDGQDSRPSCRRRCCSLWTLNACAAALHGAWVVVFILLWAYDKRPDGSRRDIIYHLYVSYATWGERPLPPLVALSDPTTTAAASFLESAVVSNFPDLRRSILNGVASPYPACEPPLPTEVAGMPVVGCRSQKAYAGSTSSVSVHAERTGTPC